MSATPLKTCPADLCTKKKWGRGQVRRKISGGAGLLFKGSGFYITDNRSENYKQGAKNAVSESRPAEKTDAKPAAKPAAPAAPKSEKK